MDENIYDVYKPTLDEVLTNALPSPSYVKPAGDAAVVALACHCLMVRDGFAAEAGTPEGGSAYTPPNGWNGKLDNEWVFHYTRAGCANEFALHCSLHSASGKMFVQAIEKGNRQNIQNLGLEPRNYVPQKERLNEDSWEGVVERQCTLEQYVTDYLAGPLANNATPSPTACPSFTSRASADVPDVQDHTGTESTGDGKAATAAETSSSVPTAAVGNLSSPVFLAAAGLAVAAAVVWVAWYSRHSHQTHPFG